MPLYVTVTPEVTVTDETNVDASTLNRLGTPTVDITGTIDGASSVTIAAGSVTNTMLESMPDQTVKGNGTGSTAAPQNVTLSSNIAIASNTLKIVDHSITTTQLATTVTSSSAAIADNNIASQTLGLGKLATQKALTLVGNGGATAAVAPEPITIGSGLTVTAASELATTTRSRTSNVSKIGVTGHGFAVNDVVNVSGMTDTSFNISGAVVTISNTDDFSYAQFGSDVVSGADTGGKVRRTMNAGVPTSTIAATSTTNPGSAKAFGTINFHNATLTGTKSGTTITITDTGHKVGVGDSVWFAYISGGSPNSITRGAVVTAVSAGVSWTATELTNSGSGAVGISMVGIVKNPYNISLLELVSLNSGVKITFTTAIPASATVLLSPVSDMGGLDVSIYDISADIKTTDITVTQILQSLATPATKNTPSRRAQFFSFVIFAQ